MLYAALSSLALGAAYFIGAVPAGVALGISPWFAAGMAWLGYAGITLLVMAAGTPARNWLLKKFRISPVPDTKKLFWRIWLRGGLPGLAAIAPVTIGPYIAALLALALGESPLKIFLWIAAAAIPWSIGFAFLVQSGFQLLR